jgi:hypothetical protein
VISRSIVWLNGAYRYVVALRSTPCSAKCHCVNLQCDNVNHCTAVSAMSLLEAHSVSD